MLGVRPRRPVRTAMAAHPEYTSARHDTELMARRPGRRAIDRGLTRYLGDGFARRAFAARTAARTAQAEHFALRGVARWRWSAAARPAANTPRLLCARRAPPLAHWIDKPPSSGRPSPLAAASRALASASAARHRRRRSARGSLPRGRLDARRRARRARARPRPLPIRGGAPRSPRDRAAAGARSSATSSRAA